MRNEKQQRRYDRYIRRKREKKTKWSPLSRGGVANLVASCASETNNPAAKAAFKWASEVIAKSGDASDIVLRPEDYLGTYEK